MIAVIAVAGVFVLLAGRASAASMEEGLLLVYPAQILEGRHANLDFEHIYGPSALWILAAAFAAFGESVLVERAVGALARAVIVVALQRLCLPAGRAVSVIAAAAGAVVILPFGLMAYSWITALAFALPALLLALRGVASGSRGAVAGGAVMSGLALTIRPDLVLAVALAWAPILVRLAPLRLPILAGFGLGSLPIWIHVALVTPRVAFDGMFTDPVFRFRGGRRLPLPPPLDAPAGFLDRFEAAVTSAPWPHALQISLWFWLLVAMAAASAIISLTWARRFGAFHRGGLPLVGAFALGALPQLLQRADVAHLRLVGFVLIPVAVAIVSAAAARWKWVVAIAAAGSVAVVAPTYVFAALGRTMLPETAVVDHGGRSLPVGTAMAPEVEALLDLVDSLAAPGDGVFIVPARANEPYYAETYLYHLLPDLDIAGYHLEMNPGTADGEGSRLARDIAAADVLIVSRRFDPWTEPNDAVRRAARSDEVEHALSRFRRVGSRGPYDVMVKR